MLKPAQFWDAANVDSFHGHSVNECGDVEVSDDAYKAHLNETNETVTICGFSFEAGQALLDCAPNDFRFMKGDYESSLSAELLQQLQNEDDTGIEFTDDELDEEEDE